jgi:hypothetical protein
MKNYQAQKTSSVIWSPYDQSAKAQRWQLILAKSCKQVKKFVVKHSKTVAKHTKTAVKHTKIFLQKVQQAIEDHKSKPLPSADNNKVSKVKSRDDEPLKIQKLDQGFEITCRKSTDDDDISTIYPMSVIGPKELLTNAKTAMEVEKAKKVAPKVVILKGFDEDATMNESYQTLNMIHLLESQTDDYALSFHRLPALVESMTDEGDADEEEFINILRNNGRE